MVSFEWWSNPNAHHAYILAFLSVILEFLATFGGIAIYMVRTARDDDYSRHGYVLLYMILT